MAEAWLLSRRVEDSTRDRYRASLDVWLLPRWRDSPIASVTEEELAHMVRDAEAAGRAGWIIKNNLVVASGVFRFAVRRGHSAPDPLNELGRAVLAHVSAHSPGVEWRPRSGTTRAGWSLPRRAPARGWRPL